MEVHFVAVTDRIGKNMEQPALISGTPGVTPLVVSIEVPVGEILMQSTVMIPGGSSVADYPDAGARTLAQTMADRIASQSGL